MNHPPRTNLLTPLELTCDRLPAALDGLRVVHMTDMHVRRPRRRHRRLCEELAGCAFDLLVMTGDYMHLRAHEAATLDVLRQVCEAAQPRLAIVGAFGNHDTPGLIRGAADLPVRWLFDGAWTSDRLPLTVLGLHYTERDREGDLTAALLDEPKPAEPRFRMLLAHEPTWLVPASQAGVDLMFAGHTHGGQVRLPGGRAILNQMRWPLAFTSGVMRLDRTTAVVSNGLGEGWFDHFRVLCPAHAPLITLRRSERPMEPDERLRMLHAW